MNNLNGKGLAMKRKKSGIAFAIFFLVLLVYIGFANNCGFITFRGIIIAGLFFSVGWSNYQTKFLMEIGDGLVGKAMRYRIGNTDHRIDVYTCLISGNKLTISGEEKGEFVTITYSGRRSWRVVDDYGLGCFLSNIRVGCRSWEDFIQKALEEFAQKC